VVVAAVEVVAAVDLRSVAPAARSSAKLAAAAIQS
jgi:hypothetical protein